MRNKNKNIHSKGICSGKMVTLFNAVVSMEFKALGNIICFHNSLRENWFPMKFLLGELSRT